MMYMTSTWVCVWSQEELGSVMDRTSWRNSHLLQRSQIQSGWECGKSTSLILTLWFVLRNSSQFVESCWFLLVLYRLRRIRSSQSSQWSWEELQSAGRPRRSPARRTSWRCSNEKPSFTQQLYVSPFSRSLSSFSITRVSNLVAELLYLSAAF